jgi:hypothetical protein
VCTLVLAHRRFEGMPLVVAANRDELLSRPSRKPQVYPGPMGVLMPRDELAGGTWLGLNAKGLFVGITNRASGGHDPSRQSRGMLVVQALKAAGAASLHRDLAALRPSQLNPFHLLYADADRAFVTWSDGERLRQYPVEPGLHVVTERSLGADDRGRAERLERLFEDRIDGREPTVELMRELLVVHGPENEPLAGSCVHADAWGYGTRSSFIYLGGEQPAAAWVEGKPCQEAVEDLAPLLRELRGERSPLLDRLP